MELLDIVKDIITAQASHSTMSSDEMTDAIKKVYKALRWVQSQEEKAAKSAGEPAISGLESIQRNKVICLECGRAFRQLTVRHLSLHGIDPRGYKQRHGIPLRQSLSARSVSAKRRRIAKERGLGEKLRKARMKKK
jgi:predicted transcriptional regulator